VQAPPPPPPTHGHPHPHGNAQQVTGMLGATVLDDVDEADETFGDESELMND
jgi:F-box and leucine-rich repeat protein GRR1